MTNSSDPKSRRSRLHDPLPPAPPPSPTGDATANRAAMYARFIPREELNNFSTWQLGSFGDDPARKPQAAPTPEALKREAELARKAAEEAAQQAARRVVEERQEQLRQARDGGYQDGYRDGLAALEAFKQSHATQTSAQVSAVIQQMQARLDLVEQDLAQRVAGIALEVARQVVRSELAQNPQHVVAVTHEALSVLLVSARHIVVRLNPNDLSLVTQGCVDALAARGARLMADSEIEAGGCVVESDIGTVDAQVSSRWQQAAAALGLSTDWVQEEPRSAPRAAAPVDDEESAS